MAVAIVNNNAGLENNVQSTITVNWDPGTGSDMLVLAAHGVVRGASYDSDTVVRDPAGDNVAFTSIGELDGPYTDAHNFQFYRLNDTDIDKSTAQDYRGTAAGGTAKHFLFLTSWSGVDQTTPVSSLATEDDGDAAGQTSEQSISSSADDIAIDWIVVEVAAPSEIATNQVFLHTAEMVTSNYDFSSSTVTGQATAGFQWDWTGTRRWSWTGLNINAAAGGGPAGPAAGTLSLLGVGT